ncbi:MAG: FG-GAP repeat domain-containing protein [Aureliella sp.]
MFCFWRTGAALKKLLWSCLWLAMASAASGVSCGQSLEPLAYNHPGLVVDLGVGLWAWPVPWDADGDGDFDLIVSCPDKPSNGVWLFENKSGDTSENKLPIFEPGRRLSSTVHYVMPSYVGNELRVMSPGIEYLDFAKTGTEQRRKLAIPGNFYKPQGTQKKGPKVRHNQWRYVDYDGDGALDLVVGIEDWSDYGWDDAWNAQGEWTNGPLHGFVILFHNSGSSAEPEYDQPVKLAAGGRTLDVFGCPSPNFVDFDFDGDLDLLCGEFLDSFTYFENIGSRTRPEYAAGAKLNAANGQPLAMDLEMIVPVAFDWDRDGDADLIVGDEDGRVALVENVSPWSTARRPSHDTPHGPPQFLPPRYFQQRADKLKCGALATPVGFDWDGDGDTDILSGNTAGYIEWFENLGPADSSSSSPQKSALPKWAAPVRLEAGGKVFRVMAGKNMSIQGPAEAKWGYTTFSVADWDADGLPDIVLNSILGRVQWLKNIGTRTAPRLAAPAAIEVEWPSVPPPKPAWTWWTPAGKELVTQWRTTPVVHDFDRDGLVDLAMLDVEGYLSWFRREKRDGQLVLLPPERAFRDADGRPLRLNDKSGGGSGRRKLAVVDWDGDGELDLLLNSSNADLYRGLRRDADGWRFQRAGTLAPQNIEGHDVSPTTVDFEGDGVPDFLGGAEDGRLYYLRNPRSRP